MFHVFGTPRSGTTLLARTLNAHPAIVVPHETDFLVPLAFLFDRIRDPVLGRSLIAEMAAGSAAFAGSLGEYLSAAEVREAIRSADYHPVAMAAAVYARVAERAGKSLAGDKSPNDLNFVRILHKTGMLDAPAKIIHIVRDVRDVMASLSRTGWGGDLQTYFARQWSHSNLYLHAAMRDRPDRYVLLRYEDFVRDPAAGLDRCCRLLGVAFVESMLDPAARDHARYRGDALHGRIAQAISPDAVGRHANEFTREQLDAQVRQAEEGLRTFGYAI
jgi:hypothetical protein